MPGESPASLPLAPGEELVVPAAWLRGSPEIPMRVEDAAAIEDDPEFAQIGVLSGVVDPHLILVALVPRGARKLSDVQYAGHYHVPPAAMRALLSEYVSKTRALRLARNRLERLKELAVEGLGGSSGPASAASGGYRPADSPRPRPVDRSPKPDRQNRHRS